MNLAESIEHQYSAALAMLRKAIELCPQDLWLAGTPNSTWHITYHTLYYTHLYLAPSEAEFVAWEHHRPEVNRMGRVPLQVHERYTQTQLLSYLELCKFQVEEQTVKVDFDAPSGFSWLSFNKLELQFYNLRHLAHHTGQLVDRLRTHAGIGIAWIR